MIATIKARTVNAARIVELEPLFIRGEMKPIHAGVLLRLDDGTSQTWLAERGNSNAPEVGDFLIRDNDLHVSAVLNPAKFSELFDVESAKA